MWLREKSLSWVAGEREVEGGVLLAEVLVLWAVVEYVVFVSDVLFLGVCLAILTVSFCAG